MMSIGLRLHHPIYHPFFLIVESFTLECLCDNYFCINYLIDFSYVARACCDRADCIRVTLHAVYRSWKSIKLSLHKLHWVYARRDGEVVGFETEATAIYDTMKYIGNEVI